MMQVVREKPKVVIIGCGFAGLWAAGSLCRSDCSVIVIDRNNYHTFLPLLYQVASAEIQPEDIAYPIRGILRRMRNADFILGEVSEIDFQSRIVRVAEQEVDYDFLIIATGSSTDFFGVAGAAEYAFSLKSLDEGIALRNHVLLCFEKAVHEKDPDARMRLLTFVIIGGGATGVEFAGALAELVYGPLSKDYSFMDFNEVSIEVIEGSDRLLPALSEKMGTYAAEKLHRMGVRVRLREMVSAITPDSVQLKSGVVIPTLTPVWTAGISGRSAIGSWGLLTDKRGRLLVLPTLQVQGHPEVYAVGDIAHSEGKTGELPLTAPVAVQQGAAAAANIRMQIEGLPAKSFVFRDRGTMVTIGRNAAVAEIGGRVFTGFLAWLLWLVVHLFNLIGFRNRLVVLIDWALDYFFYERTVRIIFPKNAGSKKV